MSTYLFIHGAFHGAWCWYKIIPQLQQVGHQTIALDLPGHGRDKTPISDLSPESNVQAIGHVLQQQIEPVILVGHSWGGTTISLAAEMYPEKIQKLIYLCAFLLRPGETIYSTIRAYEQEGHSHNTQWIEQREPGSISLSLEFSPTLLYADCSAQDIALAHLLVTPEKLSSLSKPLQLSEDRYGRIPRFYIECLEDRAISPSLQRQMYTASPCQQVFSLQTSHSPFFSAPDALAHHLQTIGEM